MELPAFLVREVVTVVVNNQVNDGAFRQRSRLIENQPPGIPPQEPPSVPPSKLGDIARRGNRRSSPRSATRRRNEFGLKALPGLAGGIGRTQRKREGSSQNISPVAPFEKAHLHSRLNARTRALIQPRSEIVHHDLDPVMLGHGTKDGIVDST